ncbi:MAG: membrane dipeptidase [Prevotella sp.]|nr:membrane dipeptidase [Prevotella sp.]
MNRFDLNARLADVYSQFTSNARRPVVGITGNYGDQTCKLAEGYYKQVADAGGTPVILPPLTDSRALSAMLDRIDALLLSGGADINPLYCGEEPSPRLGGINAERDLPEMLLTRMAYNRQMPILGICRGIQTLAVALGGKVLQDIGLPPTPSQRKGSIKHSQDADRAVPTHTVNILSGTALHRLYSSVPPSLVSDDNVVAPIPVNSFHHQAVSEPGPHLRVSATAPDGIIEAVESTEHKPVIGVQWHPECMAPDDAQPLFRWLVDQARDYRAVQLTHDHILTLDTHCDTPMLFPQGIRFDRRDDRILVDLPKMTEGRLDATIMVAYLPQQWDKQPMTPRQYADHIFDEISEIVSKNADSIAIARTPDDLWRNKREGRKSIMLGIENGLAIEGSLDNLRHFARRGIVYMTLCHNGDNDICDAASRSANTHGGVSPFGADVIREMNRLGIMVDLSHGGEHSFYDALDISSQPIVCSHSSCRALCDHPRNLTDDQMRALASKGGVCQVTLYPGFLRKDGEATILDAMAHLDHAVEVMGIEHVGLGTDFDGDGGVPGLADASELTNYTRQLLQRRYSEEDIQRLWGGNFLRVMQQVQKPRISRI